MSIFCYQPITQSNQKQSHAVESDKKPFSTPQNIFNRRSFFPEETIRLCFSDRKSIEIVHFGLAAVKFVQVGGGQNFKSLLEFSDSGMWNSRVDFLWRNHDKYGLPSKSTIIANRSDRGIYTIDRETLHYAKGDWILFYWYDAFIKLHELSIRIGFLYTVKTTFLRTSVTFWNVKA